MNQITEKEFVHLTDYMKSIYGINLTQKKTLVVGRLQNYLSKHGFSNFSDYLNYVMSDKTGEAASTLVNILTTNHTFFMRESAHFEYFKNIVLPQLAASEEKRKDLRIWSAGCSSGEEPYTLAMLIDSFFGFEKQAWDTKILATDISTKVLDIACRGIYPAEGLENLPELWKKTYFSRVDTENSMVADKIRNEVVFRRFNLMDEVFPFKKKFHVIFCRNVMIYFDEKTKRELVEKFYQQTENGGYLFIGHSESINRETSKYKYLMPAVYKKE